MARPQRDIIETFMTITGASEAIAFQKLEEHGGNLNQAINAHFNEEDRTDIHPTALAPQGDFMVLDGPNQDESQGLASGNLSSVAHLGPNVGPIFSDRGTAEVAVTAAQISNSCGTREFPMSINAGSVQSRHSDTNPPTRQGHVHDPEVQGNVIIDEDDLDISITPAAISTLQNGRIQPEASVPPLGNAAEHHDDIEEEMLQAAIEASKKEVNGGHLDQQLSNHRVYDSSSSQFVPGPSHSDDLQLAHAVSMSLKAAAQDQARHGKSVEVEAREHDESRLYNKEKSIRAPKEVGRDGFDLPDMRVPRQGGGSSSVQVEVEDIEHPLVDSLPSSPLSRDVTSLALPNGDAFPSDEWGGISSEEHDDAVMLEAAIFGGIPEGAAYQRLYPLNDSLQPGVDIDSSVYPRPMQRPPSPTLVAQRLLREQQDDEYLAALRADKEKELEEAAAREASLQEKINREEETRKKLLEREEFERRLAEKETSLPPEPSADDETAITLLVRMPDGSRRGRRFQKSDKLQVLFDFIDIGRGVMPGTYRLVRPYPRRAFSESDSELSLVDLGLSSKQEALFLELI